MRLLRNVYGEPPPLIMHPRLRILRLAHLRIRRARCKMMRQPVSLPSYWRSSKTTEQQQAIRLACKNFMGVRSADPATASHYRQQALERLLERPTVPEERRRRLTAVSEAKKSTDQRGGQWRVMSSLSPSALVRAATAALSSNGSVPGAAAGSRESVADVEEVPTRTSSSPLIPD